MIHDGNRLIVQDGKGESDIMVLIALAMAGFDTAPRGRDLGNLYNASKKLTAEDVADLDLIRFSAGRVDLVMADEIFGRDCSLFATQVADGVFAVNADSYHGWVEDLMLRAEEILPVLVGQNRPIIVVEAPVATQ